MTTAAPVVMRLLPSLAQVGARQVAACRPSFLGKPPDGLLEGLRQLQQRGNKEASNEAASFSSSLLLLVELLGQPYTGSRVRGAPKHTWLTSRARSPPGTSAPTAPAQIACAAPARGVGTPLFYQGVHLL